MELVQRMENVDDRNTDTYVDKLSCIIDTKFAAIDSLMGELRSFQNFRDIHS